VRCLHHIQTRTCRLRGHIFDVGHIILDWLGEDFCLGLLGHGGSLLGSLGGRGPSVGLWLQRSTKGAGCLRSPGFGVGIFHAQWGPVSRFYTSNESVNRDRELPYPENASSSRTHRRKKRIVARLPIIQTISISLDGEFFKRARMVFIVQRYFLARSLGPELLGSLVQGFGGSGGLVSVYQVLLVMTGQHGGGWR